jgi:hypothetical protein
MLHNIRQYSLIAIVAGVLAALASSAVWTVPTAQAATDCALQSDLPQSQCEALVQLYTTTGGPTWQNQVGWNTTNTPCSWSGVTCSAGSGLQNVTHLNLAETGLSGDASRLQLRNLPELRALSLADNQLSGSLPDLNTLTNLQAIDLSHNQLSGPLPELSALTDLQYLDLSDNQLSGSVAGLERLTTLQRLYMAENQLNGPLPDLSRLTWLERVDLSRNQLSGPLPDLSVLALLERVDLSYNQLSGSLPNLSGLGSLQMLNLSHNQLSGSLPSLSELGNLQMLDLSHNQLRGPLPNMGDLTSLQRLLLHNNALSGPLPMSMGNLSSVTFANLRYNRLEINTAPAVQNFITERDPNWLRTQTIPPTNVSARAMSNGRVRITWTPIPYTDHNGYYRILYSRTPDGPYQVLGQTTSKRMSGYTVSGLPADTYFFAVQTYTPSHGNQQNELNSTPSAEVVVSLGAEQVFLPFVSGQ